LNLQDSSDFGVYLQCNACSFVTQLNMGLGLKVEKVIFVCIINTCINKIGFSDLRNKMIKSYKCIVQQCKNVDLSISLSPSLQIFSCTFLCTNTFLLDFEASSYLWDRIPLSRQEPSYQLCCKYFFKHAGASVMLILNLSSQLLPFCILDLFAHACGNIWCTVVQFTYI